MKFTLIKLFLILSFFNAFAQSDAKKIDSLISAYTALNKFNGNILVIKSGQVVFKGSYGYRDAQHQIKNSGPEIFQLASLTKSFTAVMIMKLIEEKKLSLDTRITAFFPKLHPDQQITIANLLSHTSGIREVLRDTGFLARIFAGKKADHQEMLSYFTKQPLDIEPGSAFYYSNSGYDLLGMIIEKITGKRYEQAIQQYIFNPLKMNSSGYDYANLKSKNKTVGYDYISSTRTVKAKIWDATWSYSSGGLYSTIDDLAKFNNGLKSNLLISQQSLNKMYQTNKRDYGYGWFTDSLYNKKIAYHSGNLEGATSYFGRIPEDEICVIMLNNETSGVIETIANKVIAILYNKPYTIPKAKLPISMSNEQMTTYVGEYDISESYTTSVALIDHQLYLSTKGGKPFLIFPETANRFFVIDSNMSVIFNSNKEGKFSLTIRDGLATQIGDKK